MAERRKLHHDQAAVIQFWILSLILAGVGGFSLLFYSATRPTIYANPGIAAYAPPPGTRLVPLPRTSDAPELVDLPDQAPSPLTALAQAQPNEKPAKPDVRAPARKRPRADPREYEERKAGYAQQWNYGGYHDWNNTRAGSAGFRSWF
jgi:hypothetical protein